MHNLRPGTVQDIPYLSDLSKKFHEVSPYKDEDFNEWAMISSLRSFVEADNRLCLVGTSPNDTPVAFLLASTYSPLHTYNKWAAELAMWVEPEYRKTGMAREMVKQFKGWAVFEGCTRVNMTALPDVTNIKHFYESLGFERVEEAYTWVSQQQQQ